MLRQNCNGLAVQVPKVSAFTSKAAAAAISPTTVSFSTDITVSEKQNYDNFGWANAEEYIELEKYNFNSMKNNPNQSTFNQIIDKYSTNYQSLSPVLRLLTGNHLGYVSSSEMDATLGKWAKNDYRKEWRDNFERTKVLQQYNLSLRTRGKYLNSNITLNYKGDNLGLVKEHNNALTFSYRGDLDATKWLKLSFGTNINVSSTKYNYL